MIEFKDIRFCYASENSTSGLKRINLHIRKGEEVLKRVAQTADKLSLEPLLDRSIFKLSGGEKQKIACGCVSALGPDIIVLDEPTSNLDMRSVNDLQSIIAGWKAEGKTILIAEHRLYFMHGIADRVLYMKDGEIREEYTGEEFYKMPSSFFRERGLRSSALTKLKGCGTCADLERKWLTVKKVQFSYSGKERLLDIPSARLPENGVIAVIGHNGAGKTTFLSGGPVGVRDAYIGDSFFPFSKRCLRLCLLWGRLSF